MREVVARSLREIVIGRARGLLDKAKGQFANDAQDEAKRSLYLQTPAEALVAGRSEKGLVYYKRGCAVEGDHGGLTAKGVAYHHWPCFCHFCSAAASRPELRGEHGRTHRAKRA